MCVLQDGTDVPCVSLQYCFSYTGHGAPTTLRMDVSLRVDTQATLGPRMFFLNREREATDNVTVDLRKSVENCTTVYTYITPEVHDKLTPLVAEMTSSLSDGGALAQPSELRAILAPPTYRSSSLSSSGAGRNHQEQDLEEGGQQKYYHTHQATVYIRNNCGRDNVCEPDLALNVAFDAPEYVIGSTKDLVADIGIHNRGEDAYQAKVQVKMPRGIDFSNFLLLNNTAPDITPICSFNTKANSSEVLCEIGNPLPEGAKVTLQLVFQPNPQAINDSALDFHVLASSASAERPTDQANNHWALALPVVYKSVIDIKRISWPDGPFDYNASMFGTGLVGEGGVFTHEREVGPEVTHIYDVTNRGPSNLRKAHIFLLWPTRRLAGDPLLYLVDAPSVSSPAECHSVPDVNYLNLQVEESSFEHLMALPVQNSQNHSSQSVVMSPGSQNINEVETEELKRARHSHHQKERKRLREKKVSTEHSSRSSRSTKSRSKSQSKSQKDENSIRRSEWPERGNQNLRFKRSEEFDTGLEQSEWPEVQKELSRWRRRSEWGELEEKLSCGPTNCTRVVCSVSPLNAGDNVVIRVRSRLWVDTIEKLGMPEVKISSRLVIVGESWADEAYTEEDLEEGLEEEGEKAWREEDLMSRVWSGTVTTIVRASPEEQQRSLKWVVVVGSIVAGLLLLALLCALLWAMGFFERKRPQAKSESEPLNGNGYCGNGKS